MPDPGATPLAGARSPVLEGRLRRRQALGEEDDGQGRWEQET
jgi:hypothetical protein